MPIRQTSQTRWQSDVDALERAFVLQVPLDGFVALSAKKERQHIGRRRKIKDNNPENNNEQDPEYVSTDKLTLDDWEDLKVITTILEPCKRPKFIPAGYEYKQESG